ncbi:MAG TPA: CHAT domain-containing protein [Thermoanaerobaculia bacterium]
MADLPLLVTIDQKGIDLKIEGEGPAGRIAADSGDIRWGSEVLLLENAGEHRITVSPREASIAPGRYALQVETAPASADELRAWSLMSRAGQEAFERTPEAYSRALASCREALEAWRSLGERRWEAEALSTIAALEWERGDLRQVVESYQPALVIWRDLGERHREAATLTWLGATRQQSGEIDTAREAMLGGLDLWRSLGERWDETIARSNLCGLEHVSGSLPAALACYEETLLLFQEAGERGEEARILNGIGGVYDLLGEPDAALDFYARALALQRELGDRREEARVLNNIAVVLRPLGEWQEALRLYGQAREIVASLGDRAQEAVQLNNIGFAYSNLGEPQRALPFLEDSLKLRREVGDRRGEVITLNTFGGVWRNLGDLDKALDHHRRALELAVTLTDRRRQEAITRVRLAEVHLDRRDAAAALRELDPAIAALREAGNRRGEAQALQARGRALALAGRTAEARPVLEDVLARCRALRDPAGEAEALQALAAAERTLGFAEAARAHAGEAVARVEELRRTGFVSPALRAAFLATQRRSYALQIDLLMDSGNQREALEASERARARSLLDALHSGSPGRAGAVPAELLEQRRSLRRRLTSKASQELEQSGTRAEALGGEIGTLLARLDNVDAEIRRLDPRYAAVSEPPTLRVEEIAKLLDPGTLLLEYSLGEDRSYLWAVTDGSFHGFALPPQREIESLVRQLHEELSTLEAGAARRKDAEEALSRILLGPVKSDLARSRRLVVVPDGALHIFPFAVLPSPDSGRLLLEQLEISYVPSATTLAVQRRRLERRAPAAKWAAVLADPVFAPDDPRLADPSVTRLADAGKPTERVAPKEAPLANLERLPATRSEAQDMAALAPAGQKVWTALGLDANRDAVLAGELRDYRVVHFATHGLANTLNPELSGLVLSMVDASRQPREGFLSLADIYDLDLAADLVVLSGCRTALGKEVRGEGVMGLTRGFQYAGVPRVVASLWRVQDRTTAELMTRFYRALWQDRLPPAAALRQAQLSMRRDPRYRDPYSWAGFVLQGDWR